MASFFSTTVRIFKPIEPQISQQKEITCPILTEFTLTEILENNLIFFREKEFSIKKKLKLE